MKLKKFMNHRRKQLAERIICSALAAALVITVPNYGGTNFREALEQNVFATTAKEKKAQAEKDLNKVNDKIDDISDQQTQVQADLSEKAKKLETLLDKQKKLQSQILSKQKEIDQCGKDLAKAQKDEQEEYDSMKLRIQFMYENSTQDSIWTAIIEADGIADILNRIEYISNVYSSDRKLLQKYQDTVAEVEDLSDKLSNDMNDLMKLQEEYENQQAELEETIATLKTQKKKYAAQLAKAQQQAENYEKIIEEQGEIIRQQEAAAAAAAAKAAAEKAAREAAAKAAAEKAAKEAAQKAAEKAAREAAQKAAEQAAKEAEEIAQNYDGGGSGDGSSNTTDKELNDGDYNPSPSTGVSGTAVVNFALQYVGGPYKWGGNSLTGGIDCSGFVHQVYAHFGISTPRYSQAFLNYGKKVSRSNIQAGDVVVYPGHVAIYIGNGCIVEAQSKKAGITSYRSVDCHRINGIRRYI